MTPRRALAVSIVVDGAGTTVLLAGLPFLFVRTAGLSAGDVAVVVGGGGALGLAATYPSGFLADVVDRRNGVLALIGLQLLVSVALCLSITASQPMTSALLAALCIALGRAQNVVRDALRSDHVPLDGRFAFNASVRSWFIVVNTAAAAATVAFAGTAQPARLVAVPAVNALSFLLAGTLTARLPRVDPATRGTQRQGGLPRILNRRLLAVLGGLAAAPMLADLLQVGLGTWLARSGRFSSTWLAIATLVVLGAEVALQLFLRPRFNIGGRLWRLAPLVVMLSVPISLTAAWLVSHAVDRSWVFLLLTVVMGASVSVGYVLTTSMSLALQFSIGDDLDRGRISGVFRLAQGAAMALGGLIAPLPFFAPGWCVAVLALALMAATRLLPRAGVVLSTPRAPVARGAEVTT